MPALAGNISVTASLEPGSVYLGEAAAYKITVTGAGSAPSAVFPDIDGLSTSFSGQTHSTSQSITIINGQMTQQSSTIYYLNYKLTPRRGGTFHIPAISVTAGGQTHQTPVLILTVVSPDTDDRAWLEVDVSPNPVVIGAEFKITLRIHLQKLAYQSQTLDVEPFVPRSPPALEIPWFENLSKTESGDFRSFASGYVGNPGFTVNQYARDDIFSFSRRLITFRPPVSATVRNGKPYFVYTIQKTFKAVASGQVDVPSCVLKGNLLDQIVGPNEATQRGVYQVSNPVTIRITDPPEPGRPAEWAGAVGKFEMSASAAPLQINLGDPVTLTVTIRGAGLWPTVQAPDLAGQDDFARGFKIHDRDVPGEQTADGKVFRYTIRPAQADIRAIPPVRYAYYDPARKAYVTLRTAPIPIDIRSTEKVRLDEVVDAGRPAPAVSEMREVVEGLYANESNPDLILSAHGPPSGIAYGLALISAPALFVLLGSAGVIRSKRDPKKARARRAAGNFRKAMAADWAATSDEQFAYGILSAATAYLRDRLDLAETMLTAAEIDRHLSAAGVQGPPKERLRGMLEDLERSRYSSLDVAIDRKKFAAEIAGLILEIDRLTGPSAR